MNFESFWLILPLLFQFYISAQFVLIEDQGKHTLLVLGLMNKLSFLSESQGFSLIGYQDWIILVNPLCKQLKLIQEKIHLGGQVGILKQLYTLIFIFIFLILFVLSFEQIVSSWRFLLSLLLTWNALVVEEKRQLPQIKE